MTNSKSRITVVVLNTLLLIVISLAMGSSPIAAPPPDAPYLFTDDPTVGVSVMADDPTVIRARSVNINFNLLGGASALPGDLSGVDDVVVLNLFDDAVFTAILDRVKLNRSGSYSWIGQLDGLEYSQVILVVKEGVMAGSIALPSAFYQVRYAGSGAHAIRQMDPAAFPPGAEPTPVDTHDNVKAPLATMGDSGTIIDVLVVYTEAARMRAWGTTAMEGLIDDAEDETNESYDNSGIFQRIHVRHTAEVNYIEDGTDIEKDVTNLKAGTVANVHSLRDKYCADVVVMIVDDVYGNTCGIAYNIMESVSHSFEDSAFAVVVKRCLEGPQYSFAHELGHLMSARHDWYVDPTNNSPDSYNHGYVNFPDRWRTMMAYNDQCDCDNEVSPCPAPASRASEGTPRCWRRLIWSNPDVDHEGDPMGVPEGTSTSCTKGNPPNCDADNRKTLNNTAYTVANFRQSCRIGVTPSGYDDIGAILPQVGYSWTPIQDSDLNDYDNIKQFEIIFANCSDSAFSNGPNAAGALQQFVQNGGSLYASDYAYRYVDSAFPGHITFPADPLIGNSQWVNAEIVDPGLSNYLDPSYPVISIDLGYDHPGWAVIDSVAPDTQVYLRGSFSTSDPRSSRSRETGSPETLDVIPQGQMTDKPLAVSFRPYAESAGRVIYTTFHNGAALDAYQKKMLEYWVLIPSTSDLAVEAEEVMEGNDGTVQQENLGIIDPGETSDLVSYDVTERTKLIFAANWGGSSTLQLSVFRPDGSLYDQKETNSPPVSSVVAWAEPGSWSYQINGVGVPHNNYRYVALVGDAPSCYLYGDIDGDHEVKVSDALLVASRWHENAGSRYDLDGDGLVTVVDIMKVAARWRESCSVGQEIIVDDGDPGFVLSGPSGGWHRPIPDDINETFDEDAYFTYCTSTWQSPSINNWATWTPDLPQAGQWEVFAFVPYMLTGEQDTSQARYEVHSANGNDTVEISHDRGTAEWVPLGTFTFNAGTGGYVQLTDVTPDWGYYYYGQLRNKSILFDAMKFVPK